jgi:hypothetical protein
MTKIENYFIKGRANDSKYSRKIYQALMGGRFIISCRSQAQEIIFMFLGGGAYTSGGENRPGEGGIRRNKLLSPKKLFPQIIKR